jgi:hypothetical protein
MQATQKPSKLLPKKAGIVAGCNPAGKNQKEKRRKEKELGWLIVGKPRDGKDFTLYLGRKRQQEPSRRLPCCRTQMV